MEITQQLNQNTYDITLSGRFTFDDHKQFREIITKIPQEDIRNIVLHMSKVEFVDSAALGMLLLARNEANNNQKQITITGVTGQVKKVFDVAKLDALFSIS